VTGDLLNDAVEFGARERPLEGLRDVAVVLSEVHEVAGQFGQCGEVVGGQRLALHDREVQLDLVQPRGVDGLRWTGWP